MSYNEPGEKPWSLLRQYDVVQKSRRAKSSTFIEHEAENF